MDVVSKCSPLTVCCAVAALTCPGTYILKSVINIRKPIVLRGDGRGKTILKFPKSLTGAYADHHAAVDVASCNLVMCLVHSLAVLHANFGICLFMPHASKVDPLQHCRELPLHRP